MTCKYLAGENRSYCLASEKLMSPSVYELCTFCHGNSTDCLIFQEYESMKMKKDVISVAGRAADSHTEIA